MVSLCTFQACSNNLNGIQDHLPCAKSAYRKSCFFESNFVFLRPKKIGKNKTRQLSGDVSCKAGRFDHIPKHLRGENLPDGLMENYSNIPDFVFGLHPAHLQFFASEYGVIQQQAKRVTEESLLPFKKYKHSPLALLDPSQRGESRFTMSANKYYYSGLDSPNPPPDIPSLLLDSNVIYIGLPLVPAVTDLVLSQLLYVNGSRPGEPIAVYINSVGTMNEKSETLALDTDAYAIADLLLADPSREIHTVNAGVAFGHAGMLLSLGTKGYRFLSVSSLTSLYLPRSNGEFGTSVDILGTAEDLEVMTNTYVRYVARGTGKTEKQILKDLRGPMSFRPQEAIDYGIADIIMYHNPDRYSEFLGLKDNIFL